MQEVWLPVRGYEGLYEVSDHGRVRSLDRVSEFICRGKIKRTAFEGQLIALTACGPKPHQYVGVKLTKGGEPKTHRLHRLVAEHFLPGDAPGMEVNHKDCDKQNNSVANLEWVTHQQNQRHAADNGRMGHDGWKRRKRSPTGKFLSLPA